MDVSMEQTSASQKNGSAISGILSVVGFLILVLGVIGAIEGLESPEAGKIGVVRNGGPIDKKDVREIIRPGSGLSFVGLYSTTHYYPANQRNYIVTGDPKRGDRSGAQVFRTPTRDSVNVGVEGQVLFTVNTNEKTIRRLDDRYGTRTNPIAGSSDRKHPWEGDDGWSAFLDSWFRPTLDNALREEIAQFNCAELNASCALVRSVGDSKADKNATNVNFVRIQTALEKSLQADLDRTLGGHFFVIQKVNLVGITLPESIADAVDVATAEKARVAGERYKAQQAKYKAQAALVQARANKANPYAGLEQVMKALPEDSQPIINLGGDGLNMGFNR